MTLHFSYIILYGAAINKLSTASRYNKLKKKHKKKKRKLLFTFPHTIPTSIVGAVQEILATTCEEKNNRSREYYKRLLNNFLVDTTMQNINYRRVGCRQCFGIVEWPPILLIV